MAMLTIGDVASDIFRIASKNGGHFPKWFVLAHETARELAVTISDSPLINCMKSPTEVMDDMLHGKIQIVGVQIVVARDLEPPPVWIATKSGLHTLADLERMSRPNQQLGTGTGAADSAAYYAEGMKAVRAAARERQADVVVMKGGWCGMPSEADKPPERLVPLEFIRRVVESTIRGMETPIEDVELNTVKMRLADDKLVLDALEGHLAAKDVELADLRIQLAKAIDNRNRIADLLIAERRKNAQLVTTEPVRFFGCDPGRAGGDQNALVEFERRPDGSLVMVGVTTYESPTATVENAMPARALRPGDGIYRG
jgi:hypothetical protein